MQIKYKLLPHQKQFIKSTANTTVLLAGRGAGKSVVASFVALLSLLKQQRIIVFAQTSQALRENLMTEIRRHISKVLINVGNRCCHLGRTFCDVFYRL